mmetsp:Transcript_728/g.1753  ORF Transcript_728/g.1753 Transcript_728/m.1753 type:complete len:235 (-) Transcript_728:336-1040(-)
MGVRYHDALHGLFVGEIIPSTSRVAEDRTWRHAGICGLLEDLQDVTNDPDASQRNQVVSGRRVVIGGRNNGIFNDRHHLHDGTARIHSAREWNRNIVAHDIRDPRHQAGIVVEDDDQSNHQSPNLPRRVDTHDLERLGIPAERRAHESGIHVRLHMGHRDRVGLSHRKGVVRHHHPARARSGAHGDLHLRLPDHLLAAAAHIQRQQRGRVFHEIRTVNLDVLFLHELHDALLDG